MDDNLINTQAKNLTKAIFQHESGMDYNAKGDAGTSSGAGQWQSATWKTQAKDVLGDENAPMTPENQSVVAQGTIRKLIKQGKNAADIAAIWNSGSDKNWQDKVGTANINGQQVKYNVPQYVKSVTDLYQQYKSQGNSQTPQTPSTPDQSQPQQKDSFLGNLVKAPLTILARPFQAGAELLGASSQDVDKVTSKLTGGLVAPVPQNSADVEKDVGRGLQTAALGLGPVSGGALFGAGNSLEQGNKLLSTQTAFQTALGGAGGKILDLVGKPLFNTAGKVIGKITPQTLKDVASKGVDAITEFAANHNILPENVSKVINSGADQAETLANKPFDALKQGAIGVKNVVTHEYPGLAINEDNFNKAKENIATQYEKVLPLTPTERAKEAILRNKTGDNVYTTLAKNGINLGSDEAPAQLQQISNQFENATSKAKENEHGYFNVEEIKRNALNQVDSTIPSETARQTAKDRISKEIDALVSANKDSVVNGPNGDKLIKSDLVERLRKTGNNWTNFNSSDPEKIGQSTGYALANSVRDQVEKQGTFPAYREANKEWGKILHAQEILGKIENSGKEFKTPGGLSGSISRKILSGVLGYHTGGAGGAILAELGSEYGAKLLSNPELRTYLDRKIVEKFAGKNPTPEAISKLESEIREYIDKKANMKALPAPSYIPMGEKTPVKSGIRLIQAKKNPVSVNPKTGKFQTSYSSTPE